METAQPVRSAGRPLGLRRFSRPAERVAFILMILGVCLLFAGLAGYWIDRGFYWDELKYDAREIFLEDIGYRRGWCQWFARIGLGLTALGYVTAYHYDRTAGRIVSWAAALAHWVRTGEWNKS